MGRRSTRDYRGIPSVDAVLRGEAVRPLVEAHGRALVTEAVREALSRLRDRVGVAETAESGILTELVRDAVHSRTTTTLVPVINATGVVVHTNLGRAVLSEAARARVARAASSYGTLEYDLAEGRRGSRSVHLERRLAWLFPGQGSLAVNNNAAAVLLALNTLAEGREAILSRGEMVEIGGSFRIPDVMAKSGVILREVGTTNRTRLSDYEKAISPATGMILKVHTSNYRIVGFTQEAGVADLATLSRSHGLPLMVDQGSGCLVPLAEAGVKDEPTVGSILDQGADLVTFSGDKILGGPQSGLVVGRRDLVDAMRASPLYRALRLDKLAIAGLEATLDAYLKGTAREEIPALGMIFATRDEIGRRAKALATALARKVSASCLVDCVEGTSRVGGGAAPAEDLPTVLVRLATASAEASSVIDWESRLRAGRPPVVARVADGSLLLDLRTVDPAEESDLIGAVAAAVAG